MKICFYISALLYQHDCVVIPGLGGFIANYVPAHILPFKNRFVPPSKQIVFNSGLQHNDGLLVHHIEREENTSYEQAMLRLEQEVDALYQDLQSGKTIIIDDAGTLQFNEEKNILFTPDSTQNFLEESFGLPTFSSPVIHRKERISRKSTESAKGRMKLSTTLGRVAAIAIPLLAIGLLTHSNWKLPFGVDTNISSVLPSLQWKGPVQPAIKKQPLLL